MPKRKYKHMRGGFFDSLSNLGTSLSQGASNLWNQTKRAIYASPNNALQPNSQPPSYSSPSAQRPSPQSTSYSQPSSQIQENVPPSSTSTYGGRRTKRRRRMRGGSSLATYAAPFSGKTAEPHTWVGGKKSKKHRHRSHNHKTKKR